VDQAGAVALRELNFEVAIEGGMNNLFPCGSGGVAPMPGDLDGEGTGEAGDPLFCELGPEF